jgi:hypothetical protein
MLKRALLAVAATALVCAPPALAAKPLTLKGKIQGSGTAGAKVVALARNGASVTAPLTGSAFTLTIPGAMSRNGMSINLVGKTGRYLGPIVLATKAKKSAKHATRQAATGTGYENLSANAGGSLNLGAVSFTGGAGTPQLPLPTSAVDTGAGVRINGKGKPQGAGKLGLSKMPKSGNDASAGADPDKDGIPNAFDQDQNGNLLLNQQDQKTVTAINAIADHPFIFSSLFVPFLDSIKGEASFAANVQTLLAVSFGYSTPNAAGYNSMSVDCLGVSWCNTATVKTSDYTNTAGVPYGKGTPWPLLAGTNRREIGYRANNPAPSPSFDIAVLPNTPPANLVVGQTFAFHAVQGTTDTVTMLSLGPYFSAPPVPTKLGATTITAATTAGGETLPLPNTGTKVDITVLRPLRPPVPGAETGTAISMGHLQYGVDVYIPRSGGPPSFCPFSAFSNLSSTLSQYQSTMAFTSSPLADSADDAAPSDARTVSFTVDLAACGNASVTTGKTVAIDIVASDAANNNAEPQGIYLALQ